eukprot:scaffold230523_cov15-Tisochrysis_lutea.AAC.1
MNGFVGGRKSSKGDSSKLWDVFSLVACTLIMVRGSVQGGCFLYQHLRASDMGVLLRDLSKGWRSICLVAAVLVQLNMQAPGIKTSQGTIKQALHECTYTHTHAHTGLRRVRVGCERQLAVGDNS